MCPLDEKNNQELQREGDGVLNIASEFFIDQIESLLDQGDYSRLESLISPLVPADLALLIERLDREHRPLLIDFIKDDFDPDLLNSLSPSLIKIVVDHIGIEHLATILQELDSDDAFEIIESLEPWQQKELLSYIPAKRRLSFEKIMSYPEDSAARIMQQEVVSVPSFWTVETIIQHIQHAENLPDHFYEVYVVNPKHEPVGFIPLNQLLRYNPSAKAEEVACHDQKLINATADQEEVAYLFRHYGWVSAPIVDELNRIVGMITVDDVVDIIDEEAQKSMNQLSGVSEEDFFAPLFVTSSRRMAGLLVTFLNSFVLVAIVHHFQFLISRRAELVALMPIVAGLSGASGTQVIGVTVRALATRALRVGNTMEVVWKEVFIGCMNAIVYSFILIGILMYWFNDPTLGFILTAALIFNMLWVAVWGVVLPILVDRLGLDPAVSAGPLLTATTDVMGFATLLGLATFFLS
jgi:magnesium transporter